VLFYIEYREVVGGKDAIHRSERQVRKVFVIDGVELVIGHQLSR